MNKHVNAAFLFVFKYIDAFMFACHKMMQHQRINNFHNEILAYASTVAVLNQRQVVILDDGVPNLLYLDIIVEMMNTSIEAINNVFNLHKKRWQRAEVKNLMETFEEIFNEFSFKRKNLTIVDAIKILQQLDQHMTFSKMFTLRMNGTQR